MRRLLYAMAAIIAALAPIPARADPALWVAHGPHADVYLLGSIHILRPNTPWEGQAIHHALDAASQLWVEAEQPDDITQLQMLMVQIGLDPSGTLGSRLGPKDAKRLQALGGTMMEHMRPWLASIVLALQPLERVGYDPTLGPDHVLQHEAHLAGKAVAGFETMEQQLRILADMPEPFALKMLHSTLDEVEQGPALIDAAVAAWLKGDALKVAESLDKTMRRDAPELYRVLITDRNAAWADRVEGLVGGTETVLVTVGAGHLAGEGNLRDLLARRGIQFERVPD